MKVLVVDDHALIREAMQAIVKKLKRDAVVIEVATSEKALHALAETTGITLVLLDLNLPDRSGFDLLAEIRDRYPEIAIVVLSAEQDPVYVMKALELGVLGYIPKSAEREVMLNALRLVLSGGVYIPPQILEHEELLGFPGRATDRPSPGAGADDLGLTDRQMDVLALVMQGKSNKTICRALNLAEPTVKNHMTAILKALKVSSRTEAVITLNQRGFKFPAVSR